MKRPMNRASAAVVAAIVVAGAMVAVVVLSAGPAVAQPADAPDLSVVIDGLRRWVVGLLVALATLYLTIGGVRYMTAGGDPAQIERAKSALRNAAAGYVMAALAPVFVAILRSIIDA